MEFLPWSQKVLNDCLDNYKKNKVLSIIDIELGGSCNFRCQYCDTPKYSIDIQYDLEMVDQLIVEGNIKWIFVCGLGEPTVTKNIANFKKILSLCEKRGIACSAFSNIAEFDEELFGYVDRRILYPMFKLDSFDKDKIKQIYGVSDYLAEKQLTKIKELSKHVFTENGYTNVCASIVPSSLNKEDLNTVIDWCYSNNIFPLIGDLEDAGKGDELYDRLKLNNEELQQLSSHILSVSGDCYKIPICPSVLFGIHITHDGYVTVDKISGLSCHWFWLTEPQTSKLCTIKSRTFLELNSLIYEYRNLHKKDVECVLKNQRKLIFGGCGGDIVELLSFYTLKM